MAATSLQSPICIPGMTLRVAMEATPRIPHFTLPVFAISGPRHDFGQKYSQTLSHNSQYDSWARLDIYASISGRREIDASYASELFQVCINCAVRISRGCTARMRSVAPVFDFVFKGS